MIVVRNVFRVKFGQSKEAVALWKESFTLAKKIGFPAKSSRVLTDLVGQFCLAQARRPFPQNAGKGL